MIFLKNSFVNDMGLKLVYEQVDLILFRKKMHTLNQINNNNKPNCTQTKQHTKEKSNKNNNIIWLGRKFLT